MISSPVVRQSKPRIDCPVMGYVRRVVEGDIPAGRWIRLACQRHLDDLENGHERGLWWDQASSDFALGFFSRLRHSKGKKWAGSVFVLQPWQVFIVGSLFGWKRADGTRRYRTAFVEIPRKNGKTFLAAGLALLLLVGDGEPGAEVYSAATKREQAKLVFGEARRMVAQSAPLKQRIRPYRESLQLKQGDGVFLPVSSEAHTLDGLNPSGIIADEVHKWPSRELWDVLATATGARDQPLTLAITTAGDLEESIYSILHNDAEGVLQGTYSNDSYFAYIASADEGDDSAEVSTWRKANPNWGVTVFEEKLRDTFKQMSRTGAGLNRFKRDHLCVRTAALNAWIPLDAWDKCKQDLPDLTGQPCYGGLDMASTSDLAAFARVYPLYENGSKRYRVRLQFWCAETARDSVGERLREILRPWIEGGCIVEASGDQIDAREIKQAILDAATEGGLIEVAFDPYNARQLAAELQESGVQMFEFGQTMANYNEPSKELEASVRTRRFEHDGNPVLRWMMGGCVTVENGIGNIMPHRRKSRTKIDGIPATIMAIARAMQGEPKAVGGGFEAW
jgi:phage terminase large subunit-like protein